jgi:hypothetical protein
MEYILYIGLGAAAGLISGLFGLGGGVIIVPILIFAFDAQGISPQISTHLAIATSLACIIVISFSSIYTHQQKGAICWSLVRWITPGIIIGTLVGSLLAVSLSGFLLQLAFGIFLILVATQMLFYKTVTVDRSQPEKITLILAGSGIGAISALFGIGGGSLTVPFLTRTGTKMHQAVGSAAACGLPIAMVAAIIYGSADITGKHLPDPSLGYIYLPAWLGIVVASMPSARAGALMAHRLNERFLKQSFALLLLVVGTRFIWINIANQL